MRHDQGETLDELIQDVLDGVASEEQARRLRVRMETDPEARERYERAEQVFRALGQVPEEAPPAGLWSRVLRAAGVGAALRAPAPRPPRIRFFGAEWWRGFSRQTALSFASGLGVGAAVVALALGGIRPGGLEDPAGASGALLGGGSAGFRRVEARNLEVAGARVTVEVLRGDGVVRLRIEGRSDGEAVLSVRAADPSLRVAAVYARPEDGGGEVALEEGACRIRFHGTTRCTVMFETIPADGEPIHLALEAGGAVSEQTFRVAP